MSLYEENNDLTTEVIVAYMERKHEIIIDIARLLQELGLPSIELDSYIKVHGIGNAPKIITESSIKS